MKRCPTCNKTFSEEHLSFCINDGTPLVSVEAPADEVTQVSSSSRAAARSPSGSGAEGPVPAYQPPGSYTPPGYSDSGKRRTWPWVLGVLAVVFIAIAGLGIAAAKLIRNIASQKASIERPNNSGGNLNERNSNPNSSNLNENGNDNSDGNESTPAPTDQAKVLADLKSLEDEWTVANINADKKKLNRILADDYVGITEGRAQGKADYLKTIEPDEAIQHWEFEDLKVSLNGDRASLAGVLRLDVKDEHGQDQQLTFRFTDKFVWRDGRWQATSSEVEPVPVKPGTTV